MPNFVIRDAPGWAIGLGTAGKAIVIFAICSFLAVVIAGIFRRTKLSHIFFGLGVAATVCAFAIHVTLLMSRQYEFAYVFANTRDDLKEIYRLSAAWASQEGSFLLWTLTSSLIAFFVSFRVGIYRPVFLIVCGVALAALLGIVAFESPFNLLQWRQEDLNLLPAGIRHPVPPDGRGLNPVLENYWMAIHPWVIFTGFGSLLAMFAWVWSAAVCFDRNSWAPAIRPLAVFSTTMLGIGVVMGGLWAYETLGWGGFWAWDPVENVSLVPFLGAVAFLHALYVRLRRGRWQRLSLFLGALPLFWFSYGTFLTRSGVLADVSVHSFARMGEGAHRLLLGFVIAVAASVIALGALLLARKEPRPQTAAGGDRLIGFALGIASTYAIALIAAIGMSVPFFSAIFGRFDDQGKARVIEQATYNRIVPYAFIPFMLLMAIVPFLGWTKTQTKRWADLASIGVASLLYSGAAIWYIRSQGLFDQRSPNLLVLLSIIVFLCVSSIIANLWRTFESARKRGRWAPFAMHTGVSLLLMGLIVSSAFEREVKSFVSVTRPAQLQAGPKAFLVRLERTPSLSEWVRPENRLKVELTDLRSQSTDLRADVSHYFKMDSDDGEPMLVTRPAIFGSPLYDLYLSVSSPITTFGNSISLMPGKSGEIQNIKIEYQKFVMHGQPGMSGTRFGTKLKVVYDAKTFDAEPELVLDRGNAVRVPAPAGDDFVVVLESVQAGSHEATFSVQFSEPILPIELYYKPLTILVWIGAGMMALGGFLTMLQVRSSAKPAGQSDATDSTP